MNISECRIKIDEIDEQIMCLLNKRLEIAKKIAVEKKSASLKISDPDRESEILNKISGQYSEPIKQIYSEILSQSRQLQIKNDLRATL